MLNRFKVIIPLLSIVSIAFGSAAKAAQEETPVTETPVTWYGKLTQGALLIGQVEPNSEVVYQGERLDISDDGYFVIGFGRDAALNQTLEVVEGSEKTPINLTLSKREYKIDRVEGVPQKTVTPDPEQVKRAKAEAAKVWRARQTDSKRMDFMTPVRKPAEGRISGVYGSQRFYNGEPRRPHYGEDIAAPTGTPVYAPWSGVVTLAEPDLFYSGGTLIIDHGYRVNTTYLHLSKLSVEVGDTIQQGEKIGEVGASGRATGPHLDWRVNWGNERLDPALLPQLYPLANN